MRPGKKTFFRATLFCSVSLLVVLCSPAFAESPQRQDFTVVKNTGRLPYSSCDETELKYYQVDGLSTLIGIGCPCIWKSAIRLTQMEMAPYLDWTLTKVNVAFSADNGCPSIDIRIYIYDTGNATHPGPILANDTIVTLDTTGVIAIPLVTPVNLSGHEELWIAVEWDQMNIPGPPGHHYAWMDTLTGPAVRGKGAWIYLNNAWSETYIYGAEFDGNWGIGAIIEGLGPTELSIGNIKGPVGVTAEVSNIGGIDIAKNVSWSIAVIGGLFQKVTVLEKGMLTVIGIDTSVEIDTDLFFGFGRIQITVTAKAENAPEITAEKTAFLLGPFVLTVK